LPFREKANGGIPPKIPPFQGKKYFYKISHLSPVDTQKSHSTRYSRCSRCSHLLRKGVVSCLTLSSR
jgi:hypothetical protein